MPKLMNILAASVGGGLLLGAGIRLGESIAGRDGSVPGSAPSNDKLMGKLGALEARLHRLEKDGAPDAAADAGTIQDAYGELRRRLEEAVATRLADVESKLRAESEQSRKQMLDAFVESVQTRVMSRIDRLEEEVAGQSAAMTELRECSLRTEQTMQKLLGGLDRLILSQQPNWPKTSENPAPAEEAFSAGKAGSR